MILAVPEVVGTLMQRMEHSLLWKEVQGMNHQEHLEEEGRGHLKAEEDKVEVAVGGSWLEGKLLVEEGREKTTPVGGTLLLAGGMAEGIGHHQGEDMPFLVTLKMGEVVNGTNSNVLSQDVARPVPHITRARHAFCSPDVISLVCTK